MRRLAALSLVLSVIAVPARAQQATRGLEIKYVRDSEEYATLAREVYRIAARAVEAAARQAPAGHWAVVLDVDETALDNSAYQVERSAYGQPFSDATWLPFVARRASPPVPGVVDFVATVRRLGGHIAWITNRPASALEDTRVNLQSAGLLQADDRVCLLDDSTYTKAVRRAEVAGSAGRCSWPGPRMDVLAFVGDQMGDFPATGESDPDAGRDEAFGVRYFLIADPMYGAWERRVTRTVR